MLPKLLPDNTMKLPPQAWVKTKEPELGVVKTVAVEFAATLVLALVI
jgi:hypothetical protein